MSFSEENVERSDNVCLLGETVQQTLFGKEDPLREIVRIKNQPFEVVGVLAPKGQSASGQDQDDVIFVPYTTAMKKLRADKIAWLDDIVCTATSPEAVGPAAQMITALLRQRHRIEV